MKGKMVHVLVVTFAGQGQINPFLCLAKRLASKGLLVTFSTVQSVGRMMQKAMDNLPIDTPKPIGKGFLRFEFFSDGWPDYDHNLLDLKAYMDKFNVVGPEELANLIDRQAEADRPVSFFVSNPIIPWALDVAADAGIKCAVLWVQSSAVFSIYYHYFYAKAGFGLPMGAEFSVHLPGLPALRADELPTFLLPSNPLRVLGESILAQFENLNRASLVMVDSFEAFERPVIKEMARLSAITPIGPLFISNDESDNSEIRGDMWKAEDCMEWLDSHPPASVLYISFGSMVDLGRGQMEEIARGVQKSGRPFLWVVKPATSKTETGLPEGFLEEIEGRGKVVQWCPQVQVLSHPSIACFLTHCGWNSSLESLSCGVPIIAFPQWGSQVTNAKVMVEVLRVGVRLKGCDGQTLVLHEEVERFISAMIEGGVEVEALKKTALKWKAAARAAVAQGGSSDRNIQVFFEYVRSQIH